MKYRVVHVYPHDPQAFTQGLVYLDGFLYEGTGLNGRSTIRKVRLDNGEVLQDSEARIAVLRRRVLRSKGDTIYELTWQSEIGFLYDRTHVQAQGHLLLPRRGMGADPRWPATDHERRQRVPALPRSGDAEGIVALQVKDGGMPVGNLNELEYVKGEVLANVWQTQRIARISPKTGRVTGWIDLTGLLTPREVQVQAAAACSTASPTMPQAIGLFVTGKLWPKLFEITDQYLAPAAGRRSSEDRSQARQRPVAGTPARRDPRSGWRPAAPATAPPAQTHRLALDDHPPGHSFVSPVRIQSPEESVVVVSGFLPLLRACRRRPVRRSCVATLRAVARVGDRVLYSTACSVL